MDKLPEMPSERAVAWKHLKRQWPPLVVALAMTGLAVLFDNGLFAISSIGFSCGFLVGAGLAYRAGMNDREEIIRHVYGEGWSFDATYGRLTREREENASNN